MKKTLLLLVFISSIVANAQTTAITPLRTYKTTITAAQMATIGTASVLISLPTAAGMVICIVPGSVVCRREGGTTAYTFNTGISFEIRLLTAIGSYFFSPQNTLCSTPDKYELLMWSNPTSGSGDIPVLANIPLYFTTTDNTNPVSGDYNIVVSFLYTMINMN